MQFQILNRQSLDVDGTMGSKDPSGHGYIGFDDGINTPIPGAWALAFGSPLPHGCDGADPLNPCPGFGPPLKYDSGEKSTSRTALLRWAPTTTRVGESRPGLNLYPFDPTQGPGYIWHCHILDHEDNDMMRPYNVQK